MAAPSCRHERRKTSHRHERFSSWYNYPDQHRCLPDSSCHLHAKWHKIIGNEQVEVSPDPFRPLLISHVSHAAKSYVLHNLAAQSGSLVSCSSAAEEHILEKANG